MIIKDQLRRFVKDAGMRCGREIHEVLCELLVLKLKMGCLRAKKNGRATLFPHDL